MRLVKIEHYRCGESRYLTLAWAPDAYDGDEVARRVYAAQESYLAQAAKWREEGETDGPPNPGYQPEYSKYPELTVAEVQAAHKAARSKRDEWEARQRDGRDAFMTYLKAEGFASFWDEEPEFSVEVDWGHRHGEALDASPTDWKDLPGVAPYPKLRVSKLVRPKPEEAGPAIGADADGFKAARQEGFQGGSQRG